MGGARPIFSSPKVPCRKAETMVVKMPLMVASLMSTKERQCISRSIRLVTGCRPPPGGPIAPTSVTSTIFFHRSVLRSYQPPWSTIWRMSSSGGCAP